MRLSYANVTASLALFVALGGTSYAVTKLPKNSVGSEQVKNGSLQSSDLAAGVAVSGPRGPRGAQGPQGANGTPGAIGPSAVIVRKRPTDAQLGFAAGSSVDVATIRLPAGNWLVRAQAEAIYFPNISLSGDWFRCALVEGDKTLTDTEAFTGNVTGATHAPTLAPVAAIPTGGTSVVLRCRHDAALPSGASVPLIRNAVVTATQTQSLDVQDVSG